ncbi:MAG: hypothetical protein PHY80_03005 [Rickettsiales bacterium]|nr:hypothetical protein [Rickettsiales bacterium]
MYKKYLSITLFLLLAACFPLTGNGLKHVDVQDTKEEVIQKIGNPYSKRAFYNKEYMIYYVYDDIFGLFFTKDRLPFIGFYPFLRTGSEYWVILEDNKVVAFGSAKNFGNNIPRALNTKGGTLEVIDL